MKEVFQIKQSDRQVKYNEDRDFNTGFINVEVYQNLVNRNLSTVEETKA